MWVINHKIRQILKNSIIKNVPLGLAFRGGLTDRNIMLRLAGGKAAILPSLHQRHQVTNTTVTGERTSIRNHNDSIIIIPARSLDKFTLLWNSYNGKHSGVLSKKIKSADIKCCTCSINISKFLFWLKAKYGVTRKPFLKQFMKNTTSTPYE